jgi:inorganic pyrophosphatase
MLRMEDEAGDDTKLLAVPIAKLSPLYAGVRSHRDVPQPTLAHISHFFEHYKDLEPGKWVKLVGWVGVRAARAEILSAVKRYSSASEA